MADLVITSDATRVKLQFNDAESLSGIKAGYGNIKHVDLDKSNNIVFAYLHHGAILKLSKNGDAENQVIKVDSVDATPPTNNANLASLLGDLIKI